MAAVAECTWQLLLIGGGATLELLGILLVALDVREARRQASAVLKSEPPTLPDDDFSLFERANAGHRNRRPSANHRGTARPA